VYGELYYLVTPKWQASVGARWFEFAHDIDDFVDGLFAGGPASVRSSSREDGITPKIGLAYRPNHRVLAFFNAAEGYRPGGTNEFYDQQVVNCANPLAAIGLPVPPPRGFASDSLWNLELGARTSWLDGRLAVNGAIYHIRWEDMQTLRVVDCVIDAINFIENVGEARSDGLEIELSWRPIELAELALGAAYIDARLTENSPNISGEDGERIPTVPEWTLSASASYEFGLSNRVSGFGRAEYRFIDTSWSDFDQSLRRQQPSRQLVNLRAGTRGEQWQVELFAENVFDERGVLVHANNIVGEWQVLVQPRTVGVRARLEF
jgi:outer membrane receptor protein involved in Fe transport